MAGKAGTCGRINKTNAKKPLLFRSNAHADVLLQSPAYFSFSRQLVARETLREEPSLTLCQLCVTL